jgi:hypothetical protein
LFQLAMLAEKRFIGMSAKEPDQHWWQP